MAQINRVPTGLLFQLGLQQQGQTPKSLSDTVSGVIDLSTLYQVYDLRHYSLTTAAINPLGVYNSVEIPDGEVWLPIRMAAQYTVPIATSAKYQHGFELGLRADDGLGDGSIFYTPLAKNEYVNDLSGSNQLMSFGWSFPVLNAYPSGTVFQWVGYHRATADNAVFSTMMDYVRLRS